MANDFTPGFRDLERDIERHLERFGRRGEILGAPAIFGLDASRRAIFDAYVRAGKDSGISTWLLSHWTYFHGTNPFFDETIARFCANGDATRAARLWRHVCAACVENHTIVRAHNSTGKLNKSVDSARQRVVDAVQGWRTSMSACGAPPPELDPMTAAIVEGRDPPPLPKADTREIDAKRFFEIIGPSGPSPAEQIDAAAERLAGFSGPRIKAFQALLAGYMQQLNRSEFWALAYMRNEGCSDDAFIAFRAWTILQGEAAIRAAIERPLGFIEMIGVSGECDGEGLQHIAAIAHLRRTGKALRLPRQRALATEGEPWDEDDVEKTFPALAAKIRAMRAKSSQA